MVARSGFITLTIDRSPPQGPCITSNILVTHLFRTGEFKDRQKCVYEVLKIVTQSDRKNESAAAGG